MLRGEGGTMKTFNGYQRADGSVGVRNHVIVINAIGKLAGFTRKMAQLVPGVIPVVHQGGEAQFPQDLTQTVRTLQGIAGHPNVSAALILGMKEDNLTHVMEEQLNKERHHVKVLCLDEERTITEMFKKGKKWLKTAVENRRMEKRVSVDVSKLIVGLECGGSDAWSGITANPAIGCFSDYFVKDEGTSILAETTEAIGAEHIIAERAVHPKVSAKFIDMVKEYEERIKETGQDVRSANPSPGNIAGGLTTLEEKSLGCIKKGGNAPLNEVIDYAEPPTKKGFVFMNTPGYDVESVSGLAAGGAQIVLFSTGKGSPTGSPIVPVIKIGSNSELYETMAEHIDVNAGKIMEGSSTRIEMGEEIYNTVINTASGNKTTAEKNGNQEFAIWRLAETI